MAVKVGINGFGRIGSLALRQMTERSDMDICAINLRNADIPRMVYMTKYDSTFGRFDGTVEAAEDAIIVNGKRIRVFSENDASTINWAESGAEYIIESTGAYLTTEKASAHFNGGAKKVIITAPAKDKVTPTFVMGVNNDTYKPEYKVVSNASCTTNCLAPLAKVVNDKFGIEKGLMSTIHASTSKQKAVDARGSSDWRVCRSVYGNIIPTTTGAAKAVGLVIPELQGKLTGLAFRVPAADVSVVDLTAELKTKTTYEEICAAVKEASETYMKGIIEYSEDALVSGDIRAVSDTCVFDATAGIMLDESFVKLIAWYDNEWGYTSKVLDLVEYMYRVDNQ